MPGNEIEAMRAIDEALAGLADDETRARVLRWAVEKFGKGEVTVPAGDAKSNAQPTEEGGTQRKKRVKGKRKTSGRRPAKKASKASHSIVKDLILKPKGQQSFAEFVTDKSPSSNAERCVAAAYYVDRVLKKAPVSADHVYTCFKDVAWRIPADLCNALQWTASRKGWLLTSDMSDIRLTPRGENLIEHDLPKQRKSE